jgi:hypothetical protein
MIVRETYDTVKLPVRKQFKCQSCGRKVIRRATLWQTVNPYNRNSSGRPKTREEIRQELMSRDLEAWLGKMTLCYSCEVRKRGRVRG